MEKFIAVLENYVEADEITSEDNFRILGLSSFDTVCMIQEIKDVYGIEIQPQDFIKYKTVGAMAEYLNNYEE